MLYITNKTSRSAIEIKELIKFGLGLNVCHEMVEVIIDRRRGCYGSVSKYMPRQKKILLRIPPDKSYPCQSKYEFKNQPRITYNNWKEFVVSVFAHEYQHYIQHQQKRRFSESEAEIIARARLKEYVSKQNN